MISGQENPTRHIAVVLHAGWCGNVGTCYM